MELRTISNFVAIADAGTVVAASQHVLISQPALSRQLQQLERLLGVDLFDRDRGRLTLSRAGQDLLPLARELLTKAADFKRAAQIIATGRLLDVVIAAPRTTLTDIISPFVATLTEADPVPDVLPFDAAGADRATRDGADIVVAAHPLGTLFTSRPLAHLPVHACVRPDHPWFGRACIAVAELLDHRIITPPEHFSAFQAVASALESASLPPLNDRVRAADGVVAQALAAGGRGAAVVSDDARFGLTQIPLVAATGQPIVVKLYAGWPTAHPAAETLSDLTARLSLWVSATYPQTMPMPMPVEDTDRARRT